MTTPPLLFTFRRCPYAIRARLAIAISGVVVDELEVKLSAKPQAMLDVSPKGTVPVLKLADGTVLEQSLDIMQWALQQNDPEGWLEAATSGRQNLVTDNDHVFKQALDRYKYPNRFPDPAVSHYREEGAKFLATLESCLAATPYLNGAHRGLTDAAVVPFVRQFADVDPFWFDHSKFTHVIRWLHTWLADPLFIGVMAKKQRSVCTNLIKQPAALPTLSE